MDTSSPPLAPPPAPPPPPPPPPLLFTMVWVVCSLARTNLVSNNVKCKQARVARATSYKYIDTCTIVWKYFNQYAFDEQKEEVNYNNNNNSPDAAPHWTTCGHHEGPATRSARRVRDVRRGWTSNRKRLVKKRRLERRKSDKHRKKEGLCQLTATGNAQRTTTNNNDEH
jgi:hypothetical protein